MEDMLFSSRRMGRHMTLHALLWAGLLLLSAELKLTPAMAQGTSTAHVPPRRTDFRHTMKAVENITGHLQRVAAMGDAVVGDCEQQLNTARDALSWIATYLTQTALHESASVFRSAERALSACSVDLSLRTVTMSTAKMDLAKHVLMKIRTMLRQMHTNVETAVTKNERNPSLGNILNSNESKSFPDDAGNIVACTDVDPTMCPFTACGKGKRLPFCVYGYAHGVTGGLNGRSYVVMNDDDNPRSPQEGSLRYGVNLGGLASGGVWITFSRDMIITLKDMLWLRSATTIDGRGFNVTITGQNMVLCAVTNVILHNFQINSVGESDTVHIFSGSTRVWVDHLTSFDAKLGLVSVLQGSTDVTISNSHLSNFNFNMLLGASDMDKEDEEMRVTVYRNWFKDSMQRMPHCRWGHCHVLNNLYTNWGYYALGARVYGKLVSEYNVFVASRRSEVTPWFNGIGSNFDQSATIQSLNNLLTNGTTFHEFLNPGRLRTASVYKNPIMFPPIAPTNVLASALPPCTGALFGRKLQHCSTQSFVNLA